MSSAGDKHSAVTQTGAKMVLPYLTVKVKIKFTLEQASKAHKGSRGIALLFL
jgi:hypothetical protein